MEQLIETGKIINTHGIRGEVKIDPWADSPEFLAGIKTLYIDGAAYKVRHARVHQKVVIASLDGVETMNDAERLKNKTVSISREDANLSEGQYFIADLVGFTAVNEGGETLGKVTDVLTKPGGDILEIRGEREILVPLVPQFVVARDMGAKTVTLRLIEGM